MQEFKVNKYIILKLEEKDTVIYILGKKFRQCKYLLLNIPIKKIASLDELDSIDEIREKLDHLLEPVSSVHGRVERIDNISPETEFLGHCSNLQVWHENNYNSRLLDKNLAFPLLKRLTEVGDPLANKVFKEEIAKRIESEYIPTIEYLLNEDYIEYLSDDELITLIKNLGSRFCDILEKLIIIDAKSIIKTGSSQINLTFLERLYLISKNLTKKVLKDLFKRGNLNVIFYLAYKDYLNLINKQKVLRDLDYDLIQKIKEMIITFDSAGDFLIHLKSVNKFQQIIENLYQTGDPRVFYHLDYEGFGKYISRENYYKYLLVSEEAKPMVQLEKLLNVRYWLASGHETAAENEIVVEDKHIIELSINSKSNTFPKQIFNLKSLKILYLFMPNLIIPKNTLIKLKNDLKKFEFEFKNILYNQKEK
jgi:hypothetical protein